MRYSGGLFVLTQETYRCYHHSKFLYYFGLINPILYFVFPRYISLCDYYKSRDREGKENFDHYVLYMKTIFPISDRLR